MRDHAWTRLPASMASRKSVVCRYCMMRSLLSRCRNDRTYFVFPSLHASFDCQYLPATGRVCGETEFAAIAVCGITAIVGTNIQEYFIYSACLQDGRYGTACTKGNTPPT